MPPKTGFIGAEMVVLAPMKPVFGGILCRKTNFSIVDREASSLEKYFFYFSKDFFVL